ncbi:hypothetical protein [Pseudoteredinibacter isoporae]|uniref:Uncharacterized protein n=1 Tax=Pseudoteredinibacter isoporae TaxID=570281 RepID=A0A7X0JUQ1_9GAMM|nr:hypothetical protein [Pseudoteredinibacter isoporae]MBB6521661.1 hypothetical protein [Pseudoteredinibacter isoporae]NIB23157.1 hypothetical protein [Pseudoteredinibacter isoporae]
MRDIKTKYGYIVGRDAFHLKQALHDVVEGRLVLTGELCTSMASLYEGGVDFLAYKMEFFNVSHFECLDQEKLRLDSDSSFLEEALGCGVKKVVFLTYDYAYIALCRGYSLTFGD